MAQRTEQPQNVNAYSQPDYLRTETRRPPVPPWEQAIERSKQELTRFGSIIAAVASGPAVVTTHHEVDGSVSLSVQTDIDPKSLPESTHAFDLLFNARRAKEKEAIVPAPAVALNEEDIVFGAVRTAL